MKVLLALPASISLGLGVLFILLGAAAVWLMFAASRLAHKPTARESVLRAHRVAGYLFMGLFCFMTWLMILRSRNGPGDLPLPSMLHMLLAMVLAPLLLLKAMIARYYKSFTAALVPLGITIFTLGFVLVAATARPYLLREATVKEVSLQAIDMGAATVDLQSSEALTQKRCSRCHTLERVVGARKDAQAWLTTINRMRALPGSDIPESDAKVILSYLISENSVGELAVSRSLVDSHCGRCHALDRVYGSSKSPTEWRSTVTRMVGYAREEDLFKPGESERIIQFLSARASGGRDFAQDVKQAKTEPPLEPDEDSASAVPTISFAALIALGFGTLIWRRPKPGPKPAAPTIPPPPSSRATFILQLVRTERQTQDCVSLRFRIANRDAFRASPGQFLTFNWLVDGQKLIRSYSISSSPSQTGFVEITVKKNPRGQVSTFLNERIPENLTVEARGPAGRFCFDEAAHEHIVLFAGGSGITPMMSILRYLDDLCLETKATLYYSVSTPREIIFEKELERLRQNLRDFRCTIVVSKPDDSWTGCTGRLAKEMVAEELAGAKEQTFFLCGPVAYMDHVNSILLALGVDPRRIIRESFGATPAIAPAEPETEKEGVLIEFARSEKSGLVGAGRTLLEAAEASGVSVPYSCRQGQCGTCAVRLLKGEVTMDCEDGLDQALKAQGYVLACVALSKGSVRLDA